MRKSKREKISLILWKKYILLLVFILDSYGTQRDAILVFPPYGHSYGIRKATAQHLFLFFGAKTFFDDPQGLATTRLDSWDNPATEKDDDEVVVYGVNSGRHQIIYNTSMWTLSLYGKKGKGEGCFFYPEGIAANSKGDVFVADSGNNRVVKLFNPKSELQWVSSFDGKKEGYKGLIGPSRVALDEDGFVYVTDTGNRRIVVFDNHGKLVRLFNEYESSPTAIAVADGKAYWSFYERERAVFFAINNGKTVIKTTLDGTLLKQVNMPKGYEACYGAIDYYHNYYVTDTKNHCVLKFDRELQLLDIFGSYGTGDNQFIEPRGITIYKRYGQVFIAERKGAQYFWIGTKLKEASLTCDSKNFERLRLTVNVSEYSFISLFFVSPGSDTTFIIKRCWIQPGDKKLVFKNTKGEKIIKEELYLKIEPTYSSYTYYAWYFPIKVLIK